MSHITPPVLSTWIQSNSILQYRTAELALPFIFTVYRNFSDESSTVDYAVTGYTATPAVAADFEGAALPSGTVTFAIGEVSKTITIEIVADGETAENRTFALTLSNASVGSITPTDVTYGTIAAVLALTEESAADVVGPESSTDNAVARYNGTTGKLLQNSSMILTDAGEISGFLASINLQTGTTYTIATTDRGKLIDHANAAAITVTLPNSLPAGFNCSYVQTGDGQITFSAESGASLRNADTQTKTAKKYAPAQLYVRSNSNNVSAEWVLTGYTAA